MQDEVLVFVDLEAAGLEHTRPIIQIAAIAASSDALCERESIEIKIRFDTKKANPAALIKNSYSQELWDAEAIEPHEAAKRFAAFLRRHATFDMVSQAGRPYQLAQLAAHNANFDGPFLRAWYQRIGQFCPARYQVLCTLQRSLWWFDEHRLETPPKDFKLQTLCEYFEVPLSDDEAHDAMADVRATLGLYKALRQSGAPLHSVAIANQELESNARQLA